jgi:NAD(P)-dependent dehydrogenase (short-subunit alcohol dehydrogenase family)
MPSSKERIALVTGANRGLGLETSRKLALQGIRVILTSRDTAKGEAALQVLQAEGLPAEYQPLDVADSAGVGLLAETIEARHGHLDILVNNAGVFTDSQDPGGASVLTAGVDSIQRAFDTNTLGPLRLCQALVPLMRRNGYGRIVNVASGMGQLAEMNGGYPAYRLSKTALNALTRILSDELAGTGILVNSVCPGWVRTDMGGPSATRGIEEGVGTIVWLATLPEGSPSGLFFRDRQPIPW